MIQEEERSDPFVFDGDRVAKMVEVLKETYGEVRWHGTAVVLDGRIWVRTITVVDGKPDDIFWATVMEDGIAESITDKQMQLRRLRQDLGMI